MLLLRKNKKMRVAPLNSNSSPSVDVLRVILQLRPTRPCFSVQTDSAPGLDREKRQTPSIDINYYELYLKAQDRLHVLDKAEELAK